MAPRFLFDERGKLLKTNITRGILPANPFAQVKLCHIPEKSPAFLSPQDLERLMDVVKDDWIRDLILFAVATRLRRGELVNLRWDDVDLAKKVIRVQSREGFKVKAGRSRVVPLSDLALEVLGRQDKSTQCGLVFHRKSRKVNGTFLAAKFKRFVRAAGLDEVIHWHSLRSSFASWLVMKGVSIYAVSKLLGHSEVGVTQKCYAHLAPGSLHEEVNRINGSFK